MLKGVAPGTNKMPMIKGMMLRDALELCEEAGLRTTINGNGRVVTQSIEAGTPITKGQTIHMELGQLAISSTPKTEDKPSRGKVNIIKAPKRTKPVTTKR